MREEDALRIRSYFGQPGFARFLKRLERQYTSSREGVRGYVTLANIRDDERQALDAFYGTYSPPEPGVSKRYSLKQFEQLLRSSRFGMTVPELLEVLSGKPVLTRREQEGQVHAQWRELILTAIDEARRAGAIDSRVIGWMNGLLDDSSPGARTLRIVFARSQQEARSCLRYCAAALNRTVAGTGVKPVRLPVLAAEITGDAHAFDWKSPLGRLFWWGLSAVHDQPAGGRGDDADSADIAVGADGGDAQAELPGDSSSQAVLIREGYRRAGVADDDLSSQVMLYAPELFGICEERVLTLRQVERLSPERLGHMRYATVYMVENPSVFAELIDADARLRGGTECAVGGPVVVCGNGQPATAVLKLLDMLVARRDGVLLYYAGDLDPAGLGIARNLMLRYPQSFRAWRMDEEQYRRYADRGIALNEAERSRLQEGRSEWESALAGIMLGAGVKLHQELWAAELIRDMQERHAVQNMARLPGQHGRCQPLIRSE